MSKKQRCIDILNRITGQVQHFTDRDEAAAVYPDLEGLLSRLWNRRKFPHITNKPQATFSVRIYLEGTTPPSWDIGDVAPGFSSYLRDRLVHVLIETPRTGNLSFVIGNTNMLSRALRYRNGTFGLHPDAEESVTLIKKHVPCKITLRWVDQIDQQGLLPLYAFNWKKVNFPIENIASRTEIIIIDGEGIVGGADTVEEAYAKFGISGRAYRAAQVSEKVVMDVGGLGVLRLSSASDNVLYRDAQKSVSIQRDLRKGYVIGVDENDTVVSVHDCPVRAFVYAGRPTGYPLFLNKVNDYLDTLKVDGIRYGRAYWPVYVGDKLDKVVSNITNQEYIPAGDE